MSSPIPDHKSDASKAKKHRNLIAKQAMKHPSMYAHLVGPVNAGLAYGGYGISPASRGSVMNNLQQVGQGTMSQSTAHFNEAGTFGRDAMQSFQDRRYKAAGMEGFGAFINTLGGIGTSFAHGVRTPAFGSGASTGSFNDWD